MSTKFKSTGVDLIVKMYDRHGEIKEVTTVYSLSKRGYRQAEIHTACKTKGKLYHDHLFRYANGQFVPKPHLRSGHRIFVNRYDLNGEFLDQNTIPTYNMLGYDNSSIVKCCKGRMLEHAGCTWEYAERHIESARNAAPRTNYSRRVNAPKSEEILPTLPTLPLFEQKEAILTKIEPTVKVEVKNVHISVIWGDQKIEDIERTLIGFIRNNYSDILKGDYSHPNSHLLVRELITILDPSISIS